MNTLYDTDLEHWRDGALVRAVAAAIERPKVDEADSFVLHAPLELLARRCLLRRVAPAARDDAKRRLLWLASTYTAAGEELPDPPPNTLDHPADELARRLVAAMASGDLDDVDRFSSALADRADPALLRRLLAPVVASSLAAAAHGSIFLALLGRVESSPGGLGRAVRGLARELGRHPDWRLRWFEEPGAPAPPVSLTDALLDVPMLGPAGNNFIKPMMSQAEESGLAPRLLSAIVDAPEPDVPLVRRQLGRIAAWSMLQEPGGHAYGWTHCLTMPQAVLALAGSGGLDPRVAIAVAATHVVGFRAAVGRRVLEPGYQPAPPEEPDLTSAIAAGPAVAARFAWFAAEGADPRQAHDVEVELAGRAARHHDAHYAKYTLACFDAARADLDHRALYLAAAAFLAGHWAAEGDDGLLA